MFSFKDETQICWKGLDSSSSRVIIRHCPPNNQISYSFSDRVISSCDSKAPWTRNSQSSSLWGGGIVLFKSWNPEKNTKHRKTFSVSLPPLFLLSAALLLVWTPCINFSRSNLLMQGVFFSSHSSGIDIMLVKSRESFVDLSPTPTQFLASNFLITAEHEFLGPSKDTTWKLECAITAERKSAALP